MSAVANPHAATLLPAESIALPSAFMLASSRGRLYVPKHIVAIERFILEAMSRGDQKLTIEAPVRCGKSVYVDWHLPAWYLGSFPHKHVGIASHEKQFAASWGAKARDSLIEYGNSFGVRVHSQIRSRAWWEIEEHGGSMRTFGIAGGGITGRGFDLLILDDLIKNAADADSPVIREAQIEFLQGTVMSRLEPGSLLIVMMARWHEDDLIGWIHREMPGQFTRLRMPAIAEAPDATHPDPDPLGRAPGEPLWPQRFPLARLAQRRLDSGEYYFNANYQQRPSPPLGSVFHRDWWQRWTRLPDAFDFECWSWDMSFKDKADSSYVVGQLWGKHGADFYLRHQVRGQWSFTKTKDILASEVTRPEYADAAATILVEDKANGTAIIDDLKHTIGGLIPVSVPQESKVARARSVAGYVESGNTYIPDHAEWVPEFIEEHAVFPKGGHDDQVDCVSQAIREMLARGAGSVWLPPAGDLPDPE